MCSSDSSPELWLECAAEPGLFAEAERLAELLPEPGLEAGLEPGLEPDRLNGERDCERVDPARLKGERERVACGCELRLRKLELRLSVRLEASAGRSTAAGQLWRCDGCGDSISYSSRCRPASSRNARKLDSILRRETLCTLRAAKQGFLSLSQGTPRRTY